MAPSRWIAALVQSNPTADPVMTGAELAVLQSSARELAAIGRNLNRITEAINAKITDAEPATIEMLTALGAAIQKKPGRDPGLGARQPRRMGGWANDANPPSGAGVTSCKSVTIFTPGAQRVLGAAAFRQTATRKASIIRAGVARRA